MNCLPIIRRELCVASRQRSTFWVRVIAALTGLVIGAGCLILSEVLGAGTAPVGTVLFHSLIWICLGAVLLAGLFFTSDCLSEEKREGTLGLLFLTDLRGYDVVIGKLLATSLRGFYALLAVLPLLAITQLMGGVTAAQYWKSSLALVNALFFSLAAGMLVSALSRDSQKALGVTFLVLLLLGLGGPLADGIIARVKHGGFQPLWAFASPGFLLLEASAGSRSSYWTALLTTHLLGWMMFGLAGLLVPFTWQERKNRDAGVSGGWSYFWKYGGTRRRARLRRKLLERQPMAWLVCRERWQALGLWTLALLATGGLAAVVGRAPTGAWMVWNYIGGLFTLALYVGAASQACRFLVDARRSGLLELLLVAPLGDREIVRGQWRALLRMFSLPMLLLLAIYLIGAALSQRSMLRLASTAASTTSTVVTNQSGTVSGMAVVVTTTSASAGATGTNAAPAASGLQMGSIRQQTIGMVMTTVSAAVQVVANLVALCWFGMWMGLTSRTASLATLKTILFVQVIPWFVITFGTMMVAGLMMAHYVLRAATVQPAAWLVWWPLLNGALSAGFAAAKDIGFIVWSRSRLCSSFRQQATLTLGQPRTPALSSGALGKNTKR